MLFNYFKIAWRNITRNKLLTFINVGGLAVGIATSLLIMQYVAFEQSYDQFLDNKERIFRVDWSFNQEGETALALPKAASGAGPKLVADFPEVETMTRIYKTFSPVNVSYQDKVFNEAKILFASQDFFTVFSFSLKSGEREGALDGPNKVVLTQSAADRYFPGTDPLGKILRLKEGDDWDMSLQVTGVMEDMPANTHMEGDLVISFDTYIHPGSYADGSFYWVNFYTYLLTAPGTTKEQLNAKLNPWLAANQAFNDWSEGDKPTASVMPLQDIHLHSHYTQEMKPNGSYLVVSILMVAALVILVIAWLNYINLSTAKGLERAREVGIKKVVGAGKYQLMGQFLLEALLINLMGLTLAVTLFQFALPLLQSVMPTAGGWGVMLESDLLLPMAAIVALGSFLAGYYPARVISSYQPVAILKGRVAHSTGGVLLRRTMVAVQFGLSLSLLVTTFTVRNQVDFMFSQDLGINLDQVVVALAPDAVSGDQEEKFRLFRNELMAGRSIVNASRSVVVPGEPVFYNYARQLKERKGASDKYGQGAIDPYFLSLVDIEFVAGRDFNPDLETDKRAVVVNESALKLLQYADAEEALGETIRYMDDDFGAWTIVGVVKDHHQYGLGSEIEAMIYYLEQQAPSYFLFKIAPGTTQQAVAEIREAYQEFFPGNPFDYYFLDESFEQQYAADQQIQKAFSGFSFIAIVIACLGLFGLASFEAIQRTKEIGIRKVLGASFSGLAVLFSSRFLALLLISAAVALPVCYFLMEEWLNGYAYRMELGWREFALPLGILLGIAMITLLYHTLKTVRVNPVEALRTE
ncbi:ABC transporter permease [uncultured Imperialibacter sp.]|uniref:ABC transporter permease n=1 Tax=uncultured Imperialibacter sp. TaxID=1672639 RepID=UPI0030DB6151